MKNSQPLVSIISFCKDRAKIIGRSIDSVLSQTYSNFEFVVQDGASTDGTLEILQNYNDTRIKIISEPDSGPPEAFWKVLNRCKGEIIGTCLSDEELLPEAIERAVEFFRNDAESGAMTCDGWVTDVNGKIVGEFNAGDFNFVDYLFGRYCPFWPGTFFRKQALLDVGLKYHDWSIECLEFEIWCRFATQHVVKHVPVRISKYAVHQDQLSNTKQYFLEHFESRAKVIRKLFSDVGFFGNDEIKLKACLYNQIYLYYNHVRAYKLKDQEVLLLKKLKELKASVPVLMRPLYRERFDFLDNEFGTALTGPIDTAAIYRWISSRWLILSLSTPAIIKRWLPARAKLVAWQTFQIAAYHIAMIRRSWRHILRNRRLSAIEDEVANPLTYSPRLYHDIAMLYCARAQIDHALNMWRHTEILEDAMIDGLACQAQLLSPKATKQSLLLAQQKWARRHAQPIPGIEPFLPPSYDGLRRIRVGYYCSFMDGDTIRFIMLPSLKHHDRRRFEVFGYGLAKVLSDIEGGFETYKAVGTLSDQQFVETLRADRLDILVELTGFSPYNRFAAMASRCATVQISYLNHTGTSAVPNLDYVFADEISVPVSHEKFFTERVWRLPGCFLSYNYDAAELPRVAAVPSKSRGHITFGYFGSGGKLGTELIALWAQVLQSVPGSLLFIRNMQMTQADNRQHIFDQFRRYGISADRLRLMGGADRKTIVQCYDDIDISLDTWPYCGGNTVAESLWQGVPVITLKTDRFSGRYGASLLEAAGCAELVAETKTDYVRLAVELSGNLQRLDYYRTNLRRMVKEFGLSDAKKFTAKLEVAFVRMLEEKQVSSLEDAESGAIVGR